MPQSDLEDTVTPSEWYLPWKLRAKAPENQWLEDEISFLGWPIFRGCVGFREGQCFFLRM